MADKIIDLPLLDIQSLTDISETSKNGVGSYRETRQQSLNFVQAFSSAKTSCRVATTENMVATYDNGNAGVGATLTFGGAVNTVDGTSVINGDRICVYQQTDAKQNGIYVRTSTLVWTRASDFDNSIAGQVVDGNYVFIIRGDTNSGKLLMLITGGTIVFGMSNIDFIAYTTIPSLNTTPGLLTQTADNTFTKRELIGTPNQITITNGDGVAGNPTFSLPADASISNSLTVLEINAPLVANSGIIDIKGIGNAGAGAEGRVNITADGSGAGGGSFISLTAENSVNITAADFDITVGNLVNIITGGLRVASLTADRVPYINSSNGFEVSTITPTELGYLSGVSSAIQTQINAKFTNNVSATDRLLGRDTAGAGGIEEITVGDGLAFTGSGGIGIANYADNGTWTPTLTGGSAAGTTTYTIQNGYYTRIGNMVFATARITYTAATGTGNLILGGLPFTIKNQTNYAPPGTARIDGLSLPASGVTLIAQGISNTTTANFVSNTAAGVAANVQIASATVSVWVNLFYTI